MQPTCGESPTTEVQLLTGLQLVIKLEDMEEDEETKKVDQNSEEVREELCTKTVYIIGSPARGRGTAGSGSGMIT